ncbi:MAG: ester cyclase [Candidatus Latescibacteria bacterium]|nr:ester cyclase [Candidatus Latescibacterota bacterium]
MPPNTSPDLEASKALVRRFLQDLDSAGAQQALEHSTTADVMVHFPRGLSPEPLPGPAYAAVAGQIRAAFPDLRHLVEEMGAEGDRVWFRGTNRGTHRGEFQGIAPTGNAVAFSAMTECRIQQGKIAEMWVEADMVGLMAQLGVQLLPANKGS